MPRSHPGRTSFHSLKYQVQRLVGSFSTRHNNYVSDSIWEEDRGGNDCLLGEFHSTIGDLAGSADPEQFELTKEDVLTDYDLPSERIGVGVGRRTRFS